MSVDAGFKRKPFEWDLFEVGERIPSSQVTVTEAFRDRFVQALDLDHPWFSEGSPFGGPIAPPSLLATYLGQQTFGNLFDTPRGTGLHARQSMEMFQPQRMGDVLTMSGVISEKYERRGKRYVGIDAELSDSAGQPVLRGKYLRMSTFIPGVAREKRPSDERPAPRPWRSGRGGPVSPGWEIDEEIAPVAKLMSAQKISVYSGGGRNFHNDPEVARSYGLSRPAGMALMSNAYVSEMLMRFFGAKWFTAGKLTLTFIATTHADDLLLARGVIRGREPAEGGALWSLDVWVERTNGEKVAVGTASCVA